MTKKQEMKKILEKLPIGELSLLVHKLKKIALYEKPEAMPEYLFVNNILNQRLENE